ncbi:MAG: ASPIC/UnbV domain-containing protein, partial [Myxococcales bacterium]|nr:ASPIC/UnbV domain-containing protein [Myxococcales bacterium]
PDDGLSGCALDTDCPTGLICQAAACVNPDDLLPPDVEASGHVARPQASAGRLFTLAPDSDALLVMDPATLDIQTVPVASGPASFAVLPGQAAAVVLSPAARALTRVTLAPVAAVSVTRLARRYAQVVTSPDGRWALLWNPASTDPDAEDDGVVAVVDLEADGATCNRRAVGSRVELTGPGGRQVRELQLATGFSAQDEARVHFGLGDDKAPVTVDVAWCGGAKERFGPLAPGAYHRLRMGQGARVD